MAWSERHERVLKAVLSKFEKKLGENEIREIKKRIALLLDKFRVPEEETVRTIISYLVKELNIPKEELIVAPLKKISELKADGWATVKVKVVKLWEPRSKSIAQAGWSEMKWAS